MNNNKLVSTSREGNKSFHVPFKMNKYLFSILLFIMMIMAILIVFCIVKIYKMNISKSEMKNEGILGEPNNITELMTNLTSENEQLKKQVKQLQVEKINNRLELTKSFTLKNEQLEKQVEQFHLEKRNRLELMNNLTLKNEQLEKKIKQLQIDNGKITFRRFIFNISKN